MVLIHSPNKTISTVSWILVSHTVFVYNFDASAIQVIDKSSSIVISGDKPNAPKAS